MITLIAHFMLGMFLGGLAVSTVVPPKSATAKQLRIAAFSSGGAFLISSIMNKLIAAPAMNHDILAAKVLAGLMTAVVVGLSFVAFRKFTRVSKTQKI
jgi:hypothetical protein